MPRNCHAQAWFDLAGLLEHTMRLWCLGNVFGCFGSIDGRGRPKKDILVACPSSRVSLLARTRDKSLFSDAKPCLLGLQGNLLKDYVARRDNVLVVYLKEPGT